MLEIIFLKEPSTSTNSTTVTAGSKETPTILAMRWASVTRSISCITSCSSVLYSGSFWLIRYSILWYSSTSYLSRKLHWSTLRKQSTSYVQSFIPLENIHFIRSQCELSRPGMSNWGSPKAAWVTFVLLWWTQVCLQSAECLSALCTLLLTALIHT